MSEKVSIKLHAVLLACAMATVLAVTLWRVPGTSRDLARPSVTLTGLADASVVSGSEMRKDESRVPIRN